MTRWNF